MESVTLFQKFIDFANVFKAFIGCSYLSMPFAFYKSGILLGAIMLLIIGFLNGYCSIQIVKCKDIIITNLIEQFESKYKSGILMRPEAELVHHGQLKSLFEDRITLGHIAKYGFGKKGQWIVTICLFISQFGFCTGYFVFVGNTLNQLIFSNETGNNSSSNEPNANKYLLIYMVLVPLPLFVLFSLLRSVRNMGWISMLANFAIAFGYFSILGLLINGFQVNHGFELSDFTSVALIFGILTAAFEGIGTVIPIETSMIGNRHNFTPYIHITICLVICILGSFGIIGYLRFATDTQQIVLQNLPKNNFAMIINAILVVSVICTFPLQMFPVIEIMEFLFFRKRSIQFEKDRMKMILNDSIHESITDFDSIKTELLIELSLNDDRDVQFHDYQSVHSRTGSTNYGLIQNTEHIPYQSRRSSESVYTKKQLRMIRALHGIDTEAPTWKRNIIRISLVFLQLGLAIAMRNYFAYLSAFIGAIGSSFLCYILPAATHFKLTRETESRLYCKVTDIIIIIFGIVGSISSFVVTIYEMYVK